MSSSYDSALVDTATIEDPRLLALPRGVRLLHLEALVWSKLRRTDGLIPRGALPRMTDEPDPEGSAASLADAGVWASAGDGWQILTYAESQMSAERVRQKREAAQARYDRWQEAHAPQRVGQRVGQTRQIDSLPASLPARKGGREDGEGTNPAGAMEPAALVPVIPEVEPMSRRELAQLVRDTKDEATRDRWRRMFSNAYGHLYQTASA